ncbi:MAG: sensor histidine kinase [Paenibacillaceae bacterium]|nr:sensor histidine kinase [Paenibacillaceae bacterium]
MWSKIKHKLTLYAAAVSLLCFLVTSLFFYSYSARIITDNAKHTNRDQLESVRRNMDLVLGRIESEVLLLEANPVVHRLLDGGGETDPDARNRLAIALGGALNDVVLKRNKEIDYLEIIPRDRQALYRLSTGDAYANNYTYARLEELLQGKDSAWIDRNNAASRTDGAQAAPTDGKMMMAKRITDRQTGESRGYIVVYVRSGIWNELLAGIRINLQIHSAKGSVLFQYGQTEAAADPARIGANDGLWSTDSGGFTLAGNRGRAIVAYATSAYTSWKIVSIMSTDKLLAEISALRNLIFLVGVSCFLSSIILSLFVSYRYTTPLHRIELIVGSIRKGKGDFSQRIDTARSLRHLLPGNVPGIVLMYTVIITVPILLSVLVLNHRSAETIERQSITYYRNKLELAAQKIDIGLQNDNQWLDYLFGEKELNTAMAAYANGDIDETELGGRVQRIAGKIEEIASGSVGLTLLDPGGKPVYSGGCRQPLLKEQLGSVLSERNATRWMSVVQGCGTYYLNFGKRLIALENYGNIAFFDSLGYIALHVNELSVERAYNMGKQEPDMRVYLIDETGKVVSHPDKLLVGGEMREPARERILGASGGGYFFDEADGDELLVVHSKLATADWRIVGEVPTAALAASMGWPRRVSYGLVAANLAFIVAAIYWFIHRMNRRFRQINLAMADAAGGNTAVRIALRTGDEIERLAEGFNMMMAQLSELIEDNYRQGIRRKEAEMNALQAQINPHFLYNTLESINWEAMMMTGGANKVSGMVTALSDLLRLSISKGKEIVLFEDEINHVKNYLFIQKERYSDKFDVEWDIDPRLYGYRTLKLILQPLVENAIYHGIELKQDRGLIRINGSIRPDYLLVEIIDDGLGMSPEQLDAVRLSLHDTDPEPGRGIGIHNVNERIQLYCGKAYGITIYSEQGAGTRIEVRLPPHIGENER